MLYYRLYFFDGTNRVTHAHEFFADDDQAAIKIAQAWREGRFMELWNRDRVVHRWNLRPD